MMVSCTPKVPFSLNYKFDCMAEQYQSRNPCNHGTIINRRRQKHCTISKENLRCAESHQQTIKQNFHDRKGCCECVATEPHVIKPKQQAKHFIEVGNSCSELMRVLLDENSNLKEQNMYLQRQLNKFISRQQELNETVMEYETIMSALNAQNVRLHKEMLYFSDNANHKVDKLKTTINQFFKNNNRASFQHQQNQYEEDDTFTVSPSADQEEEEDLMRFKRNRSQKGLGLMSRFQRGESNPKFPSTYINIERDQCPFEVLLQECRKEKDPNKRKQMRKRLIELTYKRSTGY